MPLPIAIVLLDVYAALFYVAKIHSPVKTSSIVVKGLKIAYQNWVTCSLLIMPLMKR